MRGKAGLGSSVWGKPPAAMCDLRQVTPSPGLPSHLQGVMLLYAGWERQSDVIQFVGGFRGGSPREQWRWWTIGWVPELECDFTGLVCVFPPVVQFPHSSLPHLLKVLLV